MILFNNYYKDISTVTVYGYPICDWLKHHVNNGLNVKVEAVHKSKYDKKLVTCIWLKITPDEINEQFEEKLQSLANMTNKSFTFIYTHPDTNIVQTYKPQGLFSELIKDDLGSI